MADIFSRRKRSWLMSRVRSRDTRPERAVMSVLRSMRCQFGKYDGTLPGRPDIVLRRRKKVIFVHGCFWHGHARCLGSTRPVTNKGFWHRKLDENLKRDRRTVRTLRKLG